MKRFLIDENVPLASARRLREAGHDVVLATSASTDEVPVALARTEARVLVTLDGDFGFLVVRAALPAPPAVLFLRTLPLNPLAVAHELLALLANSQISLDGKLTVVEPGRIRQRPLARD